jgi:hypothetical protein
LILAKLVLDEPTIVFNAAGHQRLNQAEMPLDKATFDEVFLTTSASGHLTCRFEIESERRTFHPIKMGTWDILQKYGVFFFKSTAPVKKISLSMMGFWVNVRPSFASAHVFRAEICDSIQENYNADNDLLEKLKLDRKYNEPEIYPERRKLTGHFHSPDGTTSSIETEAFVTFANADDFHCSVALLTMISSFKIPTSPAAPMFIPMELKYQDPKKFGEYVAKQNQF